jgi:hypothetical protein
LSCEYTSLSLLENGLEKWKNTASECLHAGNFCVRCGKGRVSRDGIYLGELCDFAGTTKGYCYPTRVQIRAHKPVAEEVRSDHKQLRDCLPGKKKPSSVSNTTVHDFEMTMLFRSTNFWEATYKCDIHIPNFFSF